MVPSLLLERRPILQRQKTIWLCKTPSGLARIAFYPVIGLSGSAGLASNLLQTLFEGPAKLVGGTNLTQDTVRLGRRGATMAAAKANFTLLWLLIARRFCRLSRAWRTPSRLCETLTEKQRDGRCREGRAGVPRPDYQRYKAGTNSYLDVITTQTIALNDERNLSPSCSAD